MLGFITSVRHPLNSANYRRVERLLAESLVSWTGQLDPGWFAVIVANQEPALRLPNDATFVAVDFPAPSALQGPATGREAVLLDKGSKLAYGLTRARALHPEMTHFMFVDADDLVSNRLARLVAASPEASGWFVDRGFKYDAARRAVQEVDKGLHNVCGSAFIVREDLYPRADLPDGATQQQVVDAYGPDVIRSLFGSHLQVGQFAERAGQPLVALPFPGVLYRVGTGENHSTVVMTGKARPVSRSLASEFAVEPTGWEPWRLAMAVASPSVLVAHGKHRLARTRAALRRAVRSAQNRKSRRSRSSTRTPGA